MMRKYVISHSRVSCIDFNGEDLSCSAQVRCFCHIAPAIVFAPPRLNPQQLFFPLGGSKKKL